jgi:CheY-like chemotaxis protein
VAAAKAAGMTAHLAKPLDIPAMMQILSKYL